MDENFLKVRNRLKQINWKRIIWLVLLVVIWFILLFINRKLPFFASDEGDNFLGGKMVANGLDVYKGFISQHMPVLYYICALFFKMGARTIIEFRLLFYLLLCLIWIAMYIRYSKFFGTISMSLYPVLYICSMHFIEFGHCVLSEQMWAQGMVIILLEYLIYAEQKQITVTSSCWISFSIFISFGTAFMAAASIGIVCIGVFITEIGIQRKENFGLKERIINIWHRVWKLVIIVIFPFAVLILWYVLSGNLYNAYYGSFVVNRKYYPKYLVSIQSTWETIIGTFLRFKNWFWQSNYTVVYLEFLIFGFFLFFLLLKKRYFDSVCIFLFTILCGIRGFDRFHSIPIHGVFMMMGALLGEKMFREYIRPKLEELRRKEKVLFCAYLMIGFAVIGFPMYRPYYELRGQLLIEEGENTIIPDEGQKAVIKLTDKNERIYECILNPWYYFMTDTLPATTSAVCPWIYEAYKDDIFTELEENKPKIVVYTPNMEVWGYRFGDFAQDLCQYFDKNYTELQKYPGIFVRNDYYLEASKILNE